jgi:hypothetical protein
MGNYQDLYLSNLSKREICEILGGSAYTIGVEIGRGAVAGLTMIGFLALFM